jgi:adenine-specific DNA-methyltransferase
LKEPAGNEIETINQEASRTGRNYLEWSKKELVKELEKVRKTKKYGLVWDEEHTREHFDAEVEGKLPVLKEVKSKEVKANSRDVVNLLIEGDNYHTLSVLNYTHESKIDVIYIDPPFNTGNKTWKYNNNYVERDDEFRHSKWISFMNKRLRLAKNLLRPSGIIIVAIDDYESHTLRLLMDEIFGESNRLGTIVVVHNPRGRNDDKYFATMHEYMFVYSKNADLASVGYFELTKEDENAFTKMDEISPYNLTSFMRTGNNSDRSTRPGLFYEIYYSPSTDELSLEKITHSVRMLPINNSGEEKTWRWGKETFQERKGTELIVKKVKGQYRIFKKRRVTSLKGRKPRTVWYDPRYDASSHGIMLLQNMFGQKNVFPYPKSIWTVFDILNLVTKRDSVILDFFAGSGTTGHATSMLNKKDSGTRKYILSTDNENDICTDVCYPRLVKAIEGYTDLRKKKVAGLGEGLKYFRTAFVDSEPTDRNKKKLVDQSTEMLCLKEDCFEEVKSGKYYRIFKNNSERFLGIVYDDEGIIPIKREIKELSKNINVYVFSLDQSAREEEFEDVLHLVNLRPIPAVILNVYRRIFR